MEQNKYKSDIDPRASFTVVYQGEEVSLECTCGDVIPADAEHASKHCCCLALGEATLDTLTQPDQVSVTARCIHG